MSGPVTPAYIAVGSNIDPEKNISDGLQLLSEQVPVTCVSTFYRTEAVGRPEQREFLNGVCGVAASMEPRALKFQILRPIEEKLGRIRSKDKFADRTIDLDVVLYGETVIHEPDLRIPDPEIRERPFVAAPLLELAPEIVLPDTGESLAAVVEAQDVTKLSVAGEFTRTLRAKLGLEP